MSDSFYYLYLIDRHERLYRDVTELIAYCRDCQPDVLPHFKQLEAATETLFSELERLNGLIFALAKDASNDGYHGQVPDAIRKLNL